MYKPRVLFGWPEQVADPESVVEVETDMQRSAEGLLGLAAIYRRQEK